MSDSSIEEIRVRVNDWYDSVNAIPYMLDDVVTLMEKVDVQEKEITQLKKLNEWNQEALTLWKSETGMSRDDYAYTVGEIQLKLEAKFGKEFLK